MIYRRPDYNPYKTIGAKLSPINNRTKAALILKLSVVFYRIARSRDRSLTSHHESYFVQADWLRKHKSKSALDLSHRPGLSASKEYYQLD